MVAWVLSQLENEGQDKRVESIWFPCADEGSTPSSSTLEEKNNSHEWVRVIFFVYFVRLAIVAAIVPSEAVVVAILRISPVERR